MSTDSHRVFPKIGGKQKMSEETMRRLRELNMHELGPGETALEEWRRRKLVLPDLAKMNAYRLERVKASLRERDFAAAILMDPLNIRYATGCTNMQLWVAHNPVRYAVVFADGPVILFDYADTEHLSFHNPLIDEIRLAIGWDYFSGGETCSARAELWAAELADLFAAHCGPKARISADRCGARGQDALRARGIQVSDGMGPLEQARLIKGEEEIKAMRCAIASCEEAMHRMRSLLKPGATESGLWSAFHAENIARGGEWIETRLFTAGPRTNPWYQECSSYELQPGDWLSFDTDMIGPYGMCADLSRTWLPAGAKPTAEQDKTYKMAREQVETNLELVRPGISFRELSEASLTYPNDKFWRYGLLYHGVGLCDEYPAIPFPDEYDQPSVDGVLEVGMMLCVESYVGRHNGLAGSKIEQQVLVTESGCEPLSSYSLDLQ